MASGLSHLSNFIAVVGVAACRRVARRRSCRAVVVGEQGHYQLDRVDRVSIQIYTILACIFISTMGKSSRTAD